MTIAQPIQGGVHDASKTRKPTHHLSSYPLFSDNASAHSPARISLLFDYLQLPYTYLPIEYDLN